jgi:hypothetical protein
MDHKFPLMPHYYGVDGAKYIAEFFVNTLGIPDAGIDDFLAQLLLFKNNGCDNYGVIRNLYEQIDERQAGMADEAREKVQ